jgi:hypothetical protein
MAATTHVRARVLVAATLATLVASESFAADRKSIGNPSSPPGYVITIVKGQVSSIPEESLKLELLDVKDGRCPLGAMCIWAGHATVSLHVAKAGTAGETITLGTEAPPSMKLPRDATYSGYVLHLESLESGRSLPASNPAVAPRVTVRVLRP